MLPGDGSQNMPVQNFSVKKPLWSKASPEHIDNYRNELKNKLSSVYLNDGVKCNNLNCDDPSHRGDLDTFYKLLAEVIDKTVAKNIPMYDPIFRGSNNRVPGWNEQVRPFRDDARFWHAIWVSCGKPINTQVYFIMKRTKNIFHYAVHKVKKIQEKIQEEKMLISLQEGGSTNLIKSSKI